MKEIKLKEIKSQIFERSEMDEEKLRELAESVKRIGIAQPILVRPTKEGYDLVVGSRRVKAAKEASLDKISAVIRDVPDREALELILIENIQREDLSGVDKGKICKLLLERFPDKYPAQKALADSIGVEQPSIGWWLGTTDMPADAQRLIAPETEKRKIPKGKVDYTTAVSIARKIKEPKKLVSILKHVAKKRTKRKRAVEITERAAREPEKPIKEIIEEMRPEPELVFWEEFRKPILKGRKTVTIRPTFPRAKEGDVAWAHFTDPKAFKLKIERVERRVLGELTDEDLKGEGVSSLDEYEKIWKRIHDKWNPKKKVYVVRFEKL